MGEHALQGVVFFGVVADFGLPAVPDDVEPGAGEDADGVRVVVASLAGALVEVGGPGVGVSGVAGEVGDGVAELFVAGPAEGDGAELAGLSGRGCGAGEAGQGLRGGELGSAVADLGEQRAARTRPALGRLVKMCWSACASSWPLIWAERALICSTRVASTVSRARVMWAWVVASPPVMPRGAAIRRVCSCSGLVRPQ